jgi:tRNA (guanine-N(7)-)-methyltransferase subunit TRM82
MIQPFQCIVRCGHAGKQNILLAASGASIYGFNISHGSFLFRWSHLVSQNEQTEIESESERPGKRRRLSDAGDTSDSASADIVVDGALHPRRKKPKNTPVPAIIKMATTFSGEHVVAVTNEDKCIRVLEVIANGGGLKQLSERYVTEPICVAWLMIVVDSCPKNHVQ